MNNDAFCLALNPYYPSLAAFKQNNNLVAQKIRTGMNNVNTTVNGGIEQAQQALTTMNELVIPAPTPFGPLGHQIDILA